MQGVNMWYDEGIQPAGEWVEEIAHAIKKSSMFVVFVSPRSVDSRFVKSEVGYALSENKDILDHLSGGYHFAGRFISLLATISICFCIREKLAEKSHCYIVG
jgi:hypothetical protein